MIEIAVLEIPCCPACYDWMRPVLLFVYPFDAVVWICVNGHKTLIHGQAYEEEMPSLEAAGAISILAHTIGGTHGNDGLG